MPRELFCETLRSGPSARARSLWTLPISVTAHVVVLVVLVVIPLMATGTLPEPRVILAFPAARVEPPKAPPAAPPPPRAAARRVTVATTPAVPVTAPSGFQETGIVPEPPAALTPDMVPGGVEEPLVGGGLPAEPAPVVERPRQTAPIPVGGLITRPVRVTYVKPTYPPAALAAKIEGMVIIEATISETGEVIGTRVLRTAPLLDQAAVEAVKQWRFTPTLLNGVPVPVLMTVTVDFKLAR